MMNRDDVGVIQGSSSLSFQFETVQSLRIARPELGQHLDCHFALQLRIACAIHLAHSASANKRLTQVRPQLGPRRQDIPRNGFCLRHPFNERWGLQEAGAHMVARSEQNLHVLAEGWIGVAGSIQKGGALLGRQFERLLQQIANLLPAFLRHVSALLIWWCSQRRAVDQDRLTVAGDIPKTSAVSSIDSPPKNRSSTIRLCCALSRAKPFRASSRAINSRLLPRKMESESSSATLHPPARFAASRARA